MNEKKLIELGLLLPLISLMLIAAIYYYENGMFCYYGIPSDFIEIDLLNNIYLIFNFIPIVVILSLVLQPYNAGIVFLFENKIKYKIIGAILLAIGCYVIYSSLNLELNHMEIVPLLITLACGLLIIMVSKSVKEFNIHDDWYNIKFISKSLGQYLSYFIVVCSITCLMTFSLGYNRAKNKIKYSSNLGKNVLLLRRYHDNSILGILSNSKFNSFIIKSETTNDTICLANIK